MPNHNFVDLTNQPFNKLTVISRSENSSGGKARWKCKCVCGNTSIVTTWQLRSGNTKSCGCIKNKGHFIHGLAHSAEYVIWSQIIQRCTNPKNQAFKNYGGRGITVCKEWKNNFATFFSNMGHRPSSKHTIERINNNYGYSQNNCKWATRQEQGNNSRHNNNLTLYEWTLSLSNWARFVGLKRATLSNRIHKSGWPPAKAIFTRVRHK